MTSSIEAAPKPPRTTLYLVLCLALIFGGGGLILVSLILRSEALQLLLLVVGEIAQIAGVFYLYRYWKVLDEAAREAWKVAWLWGGCLGAAVLIGGLSAPIGYRAGLAAASGQPVEWSLASDPFLLGALACYGAQLVGCLIYWAAWWLRRR